MDSDSVSEALSSIEGGGGNATTALNSYGDKFDELFPYYLSIGMTYDQYWNDDCMLVKAYRKAEELRTSRKNQEMWLQGAYIYDAILRVSPILHAFAKKGTKPSPYIESPYPLMETEKKREDESKGKKKFDKAKARMEMFMASTNMRFKGEGGEMNG